MGAEPFSLYGIGLYYIDNNIENSPPSNLSLILILIIILTIIIIIFIILIIIFILLVDIVD